MKEEVEHEAGSRFQMFLESEGLDKERAAEQLDMRLPQLQRILQGKNFRTHWLLRMQRTFPDLNIVWLLTGKGEMRLRDEIVPTEQEKEAVRLIDEARALRNRVQGLPGKRKAELCGQVIDTAERLMEDNAIRRVKILNIRSMFDGLMIEITKRGRPIPPDLE
ncbi:MAG TPA: hypothetical protein DCE41_35995 [Cytophagales bacterium]|nr:hypothetical protein [Cytophagales bacterium]HAA23055.1 hypothetical protein [Cytophagales bacterium]HAP64607.1 hypothetical protein [Cytophagales bacterium]